MSTIRSFGYFCMMAVIAFEIGAITYNLIQGESPFYLIDLQQRMSLYENTPTVLFYWGSLLGLIFFMRDFLLSGPDIFSQFFNDEQRKHSMQSDKESITERKKLNFDKFPRSDIPRETDQRFRLFLREKGLSYLECSHKWDSYWKFKYETWTPDNNRIEVSSSLDQFLNEKKISIDEFKKYPIYWVEVYEEWLKKR